MENSGQRKTHLVLAHPDTLLREGLAGILRQTAYDVVGQGSTSPDLRRLILQLRPEIALVDWSITEANAGLISELIQDCPGLLVVMLIKATGSRTIIASIAAGARGHLSVSLPPEEFLRSLDMLIKGDVVISRDIVNGLTREIIEKRQPASRTGLSEREVEVLRLIGEGSTNREIARELFISEYTVKAHLRAILTKLDLRNRQQAAAYAVKNGLGPNDR